MAGGRASVADAVFSGAVGPASIAGGVISVAVGSVLIAGGMFFVAAVYVFKSGALQPVVGARAPGLGSRARDLNCGAFTLGPGAMAFNADARDAASCALRVGVRAGVAGAVSCLVCARAPDVSASAPDVARVTPVFDARALVFVARALVFVAFALALVPRALGVVGAALVAEVVVGQRATGVCSRTAQTRRERQPDREGQAVLHRTALSAAVQLREEERRAPGQAVGDAGEFAAVADGRGAEALHELRAQAANE